jgi:2-amino-4-hydroxy-6-hydroxymethyldihydropteridine diphosphokinase
MSAYPRWSAANVKQRRQSKPNGRWIVTAYLGLGSNVGDRLGNIVMAIRRLRQVGILTDVSPIYETVYQGDDHGPQPDFLNCVARIRTDLSPLELLYLTMGIEAAGRKTPTEHWRPRTIDIDILTYDDVTLEMPELVLPHPRMWDRAFVLKPLAHLAPELHSPQGDSVAELAEALVRRGQRVSAYGTLPTDAMDL